jgi:hypothetical protein
MKKALQLLIIIIGVSIASCKKEKEKEGCTTIGATNYDKDAKVDNSSCIFPEREIEYEVPECLEAYVMKIQEEGNKRGKNYDFHATGFVIKVLPYDSMIIPGAWGVGYEYSNPPRIDVVTYLCSDTGAYSMYTEEVMFHEFGHAALNRRHICDTLDNGDAKSIMFGGLEYGGESGCSFSAPKLYEINRDYYLDELFEGY